MTNQNRPSPCVKQVSFQDEDLCQVFYMPQDARDTMLDVLFYSPQDIRKFQDDKFEEEALAKLEAKQKEKLARKQEKEAKKQQRRQRLQARREKRQQQQKKKAESEGSTANNHHTTQSSSSSARQLKRLHSDDSCSTGDDWDSYLASTSGDSSGDYSSSDEHENDHTIAVTHHDNQLDKLSASPTSVCHHDWASLSPSFVAEHGKRSPRRRRHQSQQQSQQQQQVTPSKQTSPTSTSTSPLSPVPSTPPACTTSSAFNTSSTPPASPLLKPNKELQDDAQNDHIHSDLEALLPTTSTASSSATTSTISSTDTFVYLKQQIRGWRWATLVLLSLLVVSWIWFVAGGLQVVSYTANGKTLLGGHPHSPSKQQQSVESVVQNTKRRRFLFPRR